MVRLILATTLVLGSAPGTSAEVRGVRVEEPRAFGYFVGDTFERVIEIDADRGDELAKASLPHAGSLNYWLDLRDVATVTTTHEGGKRFRIALTYQTFYVPLEARRLELPIPQLAMKTADAERPISIPGLSITMAPLRGLLPERSADGIALRPDIQPHLPPVEGSRAVLGASAAAMLLSLALLAHHKAWGPFRRRKGRPFTEATRAIRAVAADASLAGYRDSLLALHRAFDEVSGQRLFADDLERFLGKHPGLAGRREEIGRFFESSRRVFFADDAAAAIATLPPSKLVALSGHLAEWEQRA